ncbi:hypothetical protein F2Q69_00036282 [Brassica cretica]|uniref:Ubiquitin-like protease family profile domain-containing protein n=1 Tax=Brassica cretica TaxID=69181 RepID=A0A8S9SKH2_BRACR|nr:hypothetical protein F2Q69_00036282 [Brassica cretica]
MPTSTSGAEFIETSHSPPPQLPVRLFARYCYPNKPHLNIYSMVIVIGSIVKSLKGTSELKKLLGTLKCDPMVGNVADEFSALTVFEDESGVGKIWKDLFETEDVDVRVPEVLQMLAEPELPVGKRLPLALIALVDGLLVCGHKQIRVKQSYVRMVEDPEEFLQYSWGRAAFLTTLFRLTPPAAASPAQKAKSLEVMRERLKQQTTACYGFPLALQLLAFKAIPALLARIPQAEKMTNFLEDPEGCNTTNTLLHFEDIIEVETETEWEDEIEDPTVQKLVGLMRGGHKFQTSDFVGGDSSLPPLIGTSKVTGPGVTKECPQERRRFRKKFEEPGCSSQPQRRPFRPRFMVGYTPMKGVPILIIEEAEVWIENAKQVEKKRVSVCFNNANDAPTVVANDAPTVQTLSPEATILEADQLATAVKAVFHMSVGENSGFPRVEEAPMTTGLNLLAQEVENASGVDQEDSELVDNTLALVLAKPKTFVLPSQDFVESDEVGTSVPDETNSENKETASPTNSEDYKTPPEESPTAESRTPEGGNVLNRRYSTRLTKIQEGEWKCISVRSTKVEKDKGKRIQKRSTKIGGVYTPDKKLKELFKSCQKPKYTPLADVDVKKFKELRKVLQENPKQVFEIVTGPTVSNQFFLSLARPTNWVTNEVFRCTCTPALRHGSSYLNQRCALMDYYPISCILSKVAKFEEATDKRNFNWGGPAKCFVTGKSRRSNWKMELFRDIDRVYVPMLWGLDHWEGLVINLHSKQVEILDCKITHNESDAAVVEHMSPLLRSLPYVLSAYLPPNVWTPPEDEDGEFTWIRPANIYQNERSGDCGRALLNS